MVVKLGKFEIISPEKYLYMILGSCYRWVRIRMAPTFSIFPASSSHGRYGSPLPGFQKNSAESNRAFLSSNT